jgi:predicted SAM-dependent methyltransferase
MTVATDLIRLNVGCGLTFVEGFVNVDAFVSEADVIADATRLPYPDSSVGKVYAAHMLEHLSFDDAKAALAEFRRVLAPGGELTVVVPNMAFVAAAWLHGGDRGYRLQTMFGNQQHPGEFHRNGWNKQDLIDDVREAGFLVADCIVRWTPEYGQESIILEAVR